nr:alpha/beta fold hydrolase [uncultured Holophaga sp.]
MRISPLLLTLPALLAAAQPPVREVSLRTPDGFLLKGTLTLPKGQGRHAAVLLAHQFRADRQGWTPLAERLQKMGIATLALDLRGHGESTECKGQSLSVGEDFVDSAQRVGFSMIPRDLEQAAAWLRHQPGIDARRLGVVGSSVGALSALLAAPKIHPVALAVLSPAGNPAFGPDAATLMAGAARHSRSAILVLAAEGDASAWDNAQRLKTLPGVCTLSFPGQDHGFAFLPGHSDTVAVFLGEYLRKRTPALAKPAQPQEGSTRLAVPADPKASGAAPASHSAK